MQDDFWNDRFHSCALAAGFIAQAEGKLEDSEYVKKLAYEMYEEGAFKAGKSNDQTDGTTIGGFL